MNVVPRLRFGLAWNRKMREPVPFSWLILRTAPGGGPLPYKNPLRPLFHAEKIAPVAYLVMSTENSLTPARTFAVMSVDASWVYLTGIEDGSGAGAGCPSAPCETAPAFGER